MMLKPASLLRESSGYSGRTARSATTSEGTIATIPSVTMIEKSLEVSELELYPHKGEFINYDVDTTYVMAFTVRNRSTSTQTLRFFPPQIAANAFRLVNYDAVRLAPGLSRVIDVEFSTHTVEDYQDVFVILTERGQRVEVPLIAQSAPALEIDSLVDFGTVEHNRTNLTLPLTLKNKGRREALVTFNVPQEASSCLHVNPSAALATALSETKVNIELSGLSIGKYDWPVEIVIEGETKSRTVHVTVEVVDCRSRLLDLKTGEEAVSVLFNRVYAGAKETHELLMINGSEVGVSFAFQLTNELVAKEAPPFHFHPEQGTLGPKERRKVKVVFEPPMNFVRKGWSNSTSAAASVHRSTSSPSNGGGGEIKKFEGLFSLLFVETEETHSFHVVGESTETQVTLSRTVLDFGECVMNDYRNETIEIRNDVGELPLSYSFDHVAHFRVDPPKGKIPPAGTANITVTFQPHGPGRFSEKLKLLLNKTVRRTITVIGQGVVDPHHRKKLIGGVDKLPEDFKLPTKPPNKQRSEDPLRHLYDDTKALPKPPTAAEKASAVDVGMIPAEGIQVPQPSHRIQQKELREEDEAIRSPSAHVAPMNFDVKSLIRRRFNEAPENAVERRDCRRELLPMDLLKVVAPIKTLQFERVTVGTCAVRPFYLYNGTNAAILVTMPPEDMYPELEFSPRSQVIPPSRMAAFDISLCSSRVQFWQQVVNFTVNHHHPMRVSLHADIVPIEVSLSYEEVTLSFSEFTDEPITKTSITLTNNGNCDASYWWKIPPKAPFTIEPAEGSIGPMSKMVAQITFTPLQGVFSFTCDAYLAVEGASEDKKLQLTGIVEQTNCAWSRLLVKNSGEAQIDLRRIPAGQVSSTSIYITNQGQSNAFYSFDALPEWMTVSPVCGRISAGETEDLLVSVKSDKAENISQMISCHIRGMRRPLRMHLTANVVAPPISVFKGANPYPHAAGSAISTSQDKCGEIVLNYGEMYMGYEKRLPVHVRNSGDVPAVVQLDLSEVFPDARLLWGAAVQNNPVGIDWDASTANPVTFEIEEEDEASLPAGSEPPGSPSGGRKSGPVTARRAANTPDLGASTAGGPDARSLKSPHSGVLPSTGPGGVALPPPPGLYRITIEPNSEEVLYVCYRPSIENVAGNSTMTPMASPLGSASMRKRRFQVPWKQLGADDVLHALPPLILMAVPLMPKIEIRKRVLRFPSTVTGRIPRAQTIQIRSLCLESLRWGIQGAPEAVSADNEQFLLEPLSGQIPPNGTVNVNVLFKGKDVGNFCGSFQVYVDEAPHKPCAAITAFATSTKPRIFSDKKHIVFPAIPLGVAIREVIHITNDGFDSIQLMYNGETQPLVTIQFPRGDTLTTAMRRVPVELIFSSPKPVAVQSSIRISSNKGEYVEISFCATAMNSILTTTPFVQFREHNSSIAPLNVMTPTKTDKSRSQKDGYTNVVASEFSPILYKELKSGNPVSISLHEKGNGAALRTPETLPYETVDMLNRAAFNRTTLDLLSRWFNIVLLRSPVENIVEAMQQSHGGILYDIIARLFGKRPGAVNLKAAVVNPSPGSPGPNRDTTSTTASKPQPHRLKGDLMLQNLLQFLQYYGCCIQHVSSKYLLLYEEYLEVIPKTETPLSYDAFNERLWQSWVSVLLEVVRVFFFSKFTLSHLIQQTKPMGNAYFNVEQWENSSSSIREALNNSNVYSSAESLILYWVRSCVERYCTKSGSPFAAAQKIRVSCFTDLRDARSLIAVVLVYCPAMHPFFFSGDKQVVLNPTSAADHDTNAVILLNSLAELAVPQLPTSRVFLEMNQMSLALFTSILLSYLPKFMSREVVHFEGKLLSPITRTIEVKNTTSKTRLYRVWMENPLFQPSQKELVVPPNGSAPLEVVFMPRYNRVVRGRCLLVDQTPVPLEDHVPLVFALHAAPNMEPTKIFDISTCLYEPLVQDIMVENPFQQDCVVSVRVQQDGVNGRNNSSKAGNNNNNGSFLMVPQSSYPSSPQSTVPPGFGAEGSGTYGQESVLPSEADAATKLVEIVKIPASPGGGGHKNKANPNALNQPCEKVVEGAFAAGFSNSAFFVQTDVLPLRRGENAKLPIHFVPLVRGLYTLKLTFRDEREGEFSYVVRATCKDPKPSDTMDFRTELDETCTVGLIVRSNNNAAERAIRLFEERSRQIHRDIPPVVLDWSNNVYQVEFLSEKMEGPNPFFAPANHSPNDDESTASGGRQMNSVLRMEGSSSTFPFLFMPKFAGTYPGIVRLTSPIDVRLIRLNGECVPRGQRQILRFHCPARQVISQDVTITNLSDQDWLMTATLEGDTFSGAKELRVPKGKRKEYTIKYSPQWITEGKDDTGRLILLNSGTGQKHQYSLVGVADAPLSEDIIHVECRAREHHSIVLTIPNVARHDCTYYIETDLPFTEGENSVIIPRDSFARYTLNFFPAVGGSYNGKVIFKSHQGLYVWFIVTVVVTPPEKEGTVLLQTDVRTSVVADVTMKNPMSKPMSFFVRRFGAGLYGENVLTIEPQSAAVYSCIFVPTHAGEMEGRLSFCNDEVGEFWYELKMVVVESSPEELRFSSALGVPTSARVKLTNTMDQECALQIINTNPKNFSVQPTLLMIPAMRDLFVDVTYLPTCVGLAQEGSLTLSHHQLGQWQYTLQGTGLEPEPQKKTTCVCEMGSNTALSLTFTNTLDVESKMLITFSENEGKNFSIRRAPDGLIAPGQSGIVVVLYAPHAVGQHRTTLQVRPEVGLRKPEYNVCWAFPIEANAEWRETTTPFRFRCAARKNHEELITLPAPGLTPEDKECATIHFEPDPNQHYLSAVHASFVCNLVEDNPLPDAFKASIRFTPLRSMAASGDLLVRGANGGSWRYRVYLEASPAPLDDTIQMKSAYKMTSSISFDLYNVFSYKSKFAAYLTSESSKDFTVTPTHGVLLPFTRGQKNTAAATTLRINFTPTTRVPQVEGVLVVDTEDMQWSFKVVGRLDNEKGGKR